VGVEDEDIAALRRIVERLVAKMRERPMPSNICTRAQVEAAILRAKEIQNEDMMQERERYNEMLQQVMEKRMLLQQLREDKEQQEVRNKTLHLQEQMTILQAQPNPIQPQE
jgi:hypothetical protein